MPLSRGIPPLPELKSDGDESTACIGAAVLIPAVPKLVKYSHYVNACLGAHV